MWDVVGLKHYRQWTCHCTVAWAAYGQPRPPLASFAFRPNLSLVGPLLPPVGATAAALSESPPPRGASASPALDSADQVPESTDEAEWEYCSDCSCIWDVTNYPILTTSNMSIRQNVQKDILRNF